MAQLGTMKSTESTNGCGSIIDRLVCTIKVNRLQPDNKRPITSQISYLVREGRIPATLQG